MAKANTGTTVKKVLLRIKRYWFFLILSILMAAVTVASCQLESQICRILCLHWIHVKMLEMIILFY